MAWGMGSESCLNSSLAKFVFKQRLLSYAGQPRFERLTAVQNEDTIENILDRNNGIIGDTVSIDEIANVLDQMTDQGWNKAMERISDGDSYTVRLILNFEANGIIGRVGTWHQLIN
jgi:Mg/Co/Ni transporter MgtE